MTSRSVDVRYGEIHRHVCLRGLLASLRCLETFLLGAQEHVSCYITFLVRPVLSTAVRQQDGKR